MTEAHPSPDFKQGIRNRLSFLTNITQNWHLYKANSFYNSDDSLWEECMVTNLAGILSWWGVESLIIWHCFQGFLEKWSVSHRKPRDFQLLLTDSWEAQVREKCHLKKKDFIYLFLERGERREREGGKHQCVVASHTPPTGDLARIPHMCPDWELNWFGS